MNSISISGNLGKDMEMFVMQDGTQIGKFSVSDNQFGDKPCIWWNCALFGKRADALKPYMLKGTPVTVIGQVTQREYEGKSFFDIRVDNILLQGKSQSNGERPAPQPKQSNGIVPQSAMKGADIPYDDIPF